MKKVYCTVLSLMIPFLGFSKSVEGEEKKNKTAETSTIEEVKEGEEGKGSFAFSGYLDSYYMANFNKPASRSNMGRANARVFDQKSGQFSLGLVQAKAVYTNTKSEAVVDLTFGPNADLGNYGNVLGPLGSTSTALAIKQAYFTYKFTDKFSMTAGQFGTHIGYEVIDAPANFNYSLSNLFNNGPFYHMGLKATYAFSDRVSLMAGVVNNVDGLGDNNRKKGIISQLFVSPVTNWNVYLNFINSNEANPEENGDSPKAHYRVFDITSSYQLTPKFLVGVNAAYGSQQGDYQGLGGPTDTQTWGGAAVYSNVALTDNFAIGARYEYFNNDNGVRALLAYPNGESGDAVGTHVNSVTLTGNISLADGHILVKPEFRLDAYPKASTGNQQFEDSDGKFTKNSQTTFGLAFIYKF